MRNRKLIVSMVSTIIIVMLFSGCTQKDAVTEDETGTLKSRIAELNDDLSRLSDKIVELKEDAEKNMNLLAECMEEKQQASSGDVIIRATSDSFEAGEWTILESYGYDLNNDGTEEIISLYTSALKDESGIIMWDDGQTFVLSVNENGNIYTLFNGYVQIGRVYFSLYAGDESGIILTVSTYAGIQMEDYQYKQDGSFAKRIIYAPDNLNIIYNSMPWD